MTFRTRLLTMLAFAAFASVQSLPAADTEVFGGYSFTNMRPDNGADSVTINGWNTAITTYLWGRLGVTADVAGHYGTATAIYPATAGVTFNSADSSIRQYSFMAGPQIRLLHNQRIETSFRALFGGTYAYAPDASAIAGQSTFSALFGSNLDVKVSKRVSMRFSPGLYLTQFGESQTQKNFRFSVGPVFRFGSGS